MRRRHHPQRSVCRLHVGCEHDQRAQDASGGRACLVQAVQHHVHGHLRRRGRTPHLRAAPDVFLRPRLEVECPGHLPGGDLGGGGHLPGRGLGLPAHHPRPADVPRAPHHPGHALLQGPAAHDRLRHAVAGLALLGAPAAPHHHVPLCGLFHAGHHHVLPKRRGAQRLRPRGHHQLVRLRVRHDVHFAGDDHRRPELVRRRPAPGGDLHALPVPLLLLCCLRGHRGPQRAYRHLRGASPGAQRPRQGPRDPDRAEAQRDFPRGDEANIRGGRRGWLRDHQLGRVQGVPGE
mmetsp:Transcript_14178/g.44554  ORF Transcript_14178/g.44554 Transcript_14178/m.44554 type:complete len:290 (-) Transcript_14178:476-1345(-)